MRLHAIRSIEIEAPYEKAFRFIADPVNLPRWAEAFTLVDGDRAQMRTPAGKANVTLRVDAHEDSGTIDWLMMFEAGAAASAHSRLLRGAGHLVYAFVLHAPPVPLEELEGALDAQSQTLARELQHLKRVLESDAATR